MWAHLCVFLFFLPRICGNTREKERIFKQEIRSLKRELQDQMDILRDEIAQERREFKTLWALYLTNCRRTPVGGNPVAGKFEEMEILKADVEQYDANLEDLKNKLEIAKYAFRSEEDMVDVRTRLADLHRHQDQLRYEMEKEKQSPHNPTEDAERLRHEIFFLTHMEEKHQLDDMLPKPIQWIPIRSRPEFSNQPKAALDIKIKACTPYESDCQIQDITPLSDYSFIVTYFHQKVVRHFRRDGLLLNELSFPWYVRGCLGLNATHALVGVPQNQTIMILSFGHKIEAKAHVQFDTQCGWDIDLLDDYYVVLCHKPNSIRVYTKDWRWIRMVFKDSQKEVLGNPWFLTVNTVRRQIMVSDYNYTCVTSFDEFGNILWTTHNNATVSPRGMVVDPNGDWLVCDELDNIIVKMSPSGLYIEDVFQVKSPRAIAWMIDEKNSGLYQKKLVIGSSTGFIYICRLR